MRMRLAASGMSCLIRVSLKFEYQHEVDVLGNASTETLNQAEVKEIQENFSFRLIRHPINIGFARNYLYAFREARGE